MARLLLAVTAVAAMLVAAVVAQQHPCAGLTCSGRGRCEAAVGCICWAGYEGTNCERESVQAAAAPAPAAGATALVAPGPAVGLSTGQNVMPRPIYLAPEYMRPKPYYFDSGSVQPEMGTAKPYYFDTMRPTIRPKPYYFDNPSYNPNAAYGNMGAGNWWYNNFYNQYPAYNPGRYFDYAYDPYGNYMGNYNYNNGGYNQYPSQVYAPSPARPEVSDCIGCAPSPARPEASDCIGCAPSPPRPEVSDCTGFGLIEPAQVYPLNPSAGEVSDWTGGGSCWVTPEGHKICT